MGRWAKALMAVLLGNLVYFAVMPMLPLSARHAPERVDWGLLLDFAFCALFYGLLQIPWRTGHQRRE